MVIGLAKLVLDERNEQIICSFHVSTNGLYVISFVGTEMREKGKETVWLFIQPYHISQKFEIRFGIVMLFHYVTKNLSTPSEYAVTFSTKLIMHECYGWMIPSVSSNSPKRQWVYLNRASWIMDLY
jgi:hypothetical protein